MPPKIRDLISDKKLREVFDVRNIGLYVFLVIVLAISWSGVKVLQRNYELQKKVAEINQRNEVLRLQNENAQLKNTYYESRHFQELAARQNLGLSMPGETVLIVPKNVAMNYVTPEKSPEVSEKKALKKSMVSKNLDAWSDFLMGRPPSSD